MPIISQFYGIIVSIYFNDEIKHNLPHIHVRYNEYKAVYDFEANILNGNLPLKQRKLIEAWVIIRKEELITLWNLMKIVYRLVNIMEL